MTDLPIIIKGIMSVEDAVLAVENKVPAIILSNHGGRQLDGSPSSLEVALEIYEKAPDVFKQTEVYADGGVRYGADVLKLLSLGVKAVGMGRPFMYANIFGQEGIEKVIKIIKHEIAIDAGNLGVPDLQEIDPSYVSVRSLERTINTLIIDRLTGPQTTGQVEKHGYLVTGLGLLKEAAA